MGCGAVRTETNEVRTVGVKHFVAGGQDLNNDRKREEENGLSKEERATIVQCETPEKDNLRNVRTNTSIAPPIHANSPPVPKKEQLDPNNFPLQQPFIYPVKEVDDERIKYREFT